MRIFISWSKSEGLDYAKEIKELLESLDSSFKIFISETDIAGGDIVQKSILDNIALSEIIILCLTKKSKFSPWVIYEAGFAHGLNKTIVPILFDNDPNWHSWIDNPLNLAKEININSLDFDKLLFKTLKINDSMTNIEKVERFKSKIKNIKASNMPIDEECEEFVEKLINSKSFVIDNPIYRNREVHFFTGFESFELYKSLTDAFLETGKYFWIYGRKNMKLFGGNFQELFDYLIEQTSKPLMNGIDFRCLFLNPSSTELHNAHQNQRIFKNELTSTLYRAQDVIQNNDILEKCFRLYSNKRDAVIIRIDNCIIYSNAKRDENGVPHLLTNSPFEVFSVNSLRGQECVKQFENVWNKADLFENLDL